MQHLKNLIPIFFFAVINMGCNAQNQETYWKITDIYREDKKPFIGLTGAMMEALLDNNFHFIKRNDTLYFDIPDKFSVDMKNFKSLKQLQITDRDYYEMYESNFSGNTFKIMFKDNATRSDSKNTVMEFSKISKEDYDEDIKKAVAEGKEIVAKINQLKADLQQSPQIKLDPLKQLPSKPFELINVEGSEVNVLVPQEVELNETGSIKNENFGGIKVGTFQDHAIVYDIKHPNHNYGLRQLAVYLSTDSAAFSMDKYIAEHPNFVLLKRDKDNILGYDLSYDEETKKAVIQSNFCLKYYKVGKTHVFIYADVSRSEMKNAENDEKMNKIINFNYLILENIKLGKDQRVD